RTHERIVAVENDYLATLARDFLLVVEKSGEGFPLEAETEAMRASSCALGAAIETARSSVCKRMEEAAAASDPEASKLRYAEILELRARKWFAGKLPELQKRIEALKVLAAISQAESSCDTTATSHFAAKLAAEYVTGRLEGAFGDELRRLQIRQLPVILTKSRTERGTSLHKVQLSGMTFKASPAEVLSEGEQKCIAIAAFLAEISLREDGSGIVFDDPVSSLDHRWRIEVARRLAAEALRRQVIVFTHDIVFLMFIIEEAHAAGVTAKELRLRRSREAVGICEDGLPWAGMTVGKRIGVLRDRLQRARAIYAREGDGPYEDHARVTYAMLREAWERSVEEVLLNDAVARLRRSIETKRLSKVADISDQDIATVEAAMTRCSRYMVGHDEAAGISEPVPGCEELDDDIENLAGWVSVVRQRRG
ncbi:MAG: AAA family ATPase, partial [Actinobacteria bacterium]|nr:AAA family ATPase [Actinomycetota bacterium]